ncbi:aldehyde dehydrogenase [Streptomyces sp. NPDC091219]|uniref:aldehyde dehydrogenase n=1 Tax=Streptomyces sp. NPDC091219 TaxID=3155193 RepID=UPI00344DBD0F
MTPAVDIPLRHPDRLYIGGQWVTSSGDAMFDVITPATEETGFRVAEATEADVAAAVTAARTAFDQGPWPRMTHAERADCLRRIADGLDRRADDLASLAPRESGVIRSLAHRSASLLGPVFRSFADMADTFPFVEQHVPGPTGGGGTGLLVQEPVGVVAAIVPWNGPSLIGAYKTSPALLAGCTVVLKMPPEAPSAGYILAEVAEEAGLPAGVLNVVTADREASAALVQDPRVDKVSFTGSNATGLAIATACASRLARVTLELGGKSAALILDDYDLEKAARTLASATRHLSGQVCYATTRLIVDRHRHDAFVEALADAFGSTRVGDPLDPATEMGPVISAHQRDRIEGYLAKGRADGARLVTGGGRPAHLGRGFYIEPTVFADVDNQSVIAQEEIFGPVLTVIAADGQDDAIAKANDTVYGLNASVYTDDVERAYSIARQLRSGTVGHNGPRTDGTITFGGFKQSGIGREGGTEGLRAFLEPKTVLLDATPQQHS